jgi:hypothetical protein
MPTAHGSVADFEALAELQRSLGFEKVTVVFEQPPAA